MADSESTKSSKSGARGAAAKQSVENGENGNGENGTDAPPMIPIGQLISDGPTLLGHPSHTVAGALHGRDPDEGMVIDDAKAVVEDWLQRPVEQDPATATVEEGEES